MIFMQTMDAVLARRKSQTRRLCRPGDRLTRLNGALAVLDINGRPRWVVGKSYTIHRRRGVKGEPGLRLLVKDLRRDRIPLEISEADAIAEGFESSKAFQEAWMKLHGRYAVDAAWAIQFELIETAVTT